MQNLVTLYLNRDRNPHGTLFFRRQLGRLEEDPAFQGQIRVRALDRALAGHVDADDAPVLQRAGGREHDLHGARASILSYDVGIALHGDDMLALGQFLHHRLKVDVALAFLFADQFLRPLLFLTSGGGRLVASPVDGRRELPGDAVMRQHRIFRVVYGFFLRIQKVFAKSG